MYLDVKAGLRAPLDDIFADELSSLQVFDRGITVKDNHRNGLVNWVIAAPAGHPMTCAGLRYISAHPSLTLGVPKCNHHIHP